MAASSALTSFFVSIPPCPRQHPWSTGTCRDTVEEEVCLCWRDTGNSHRVVEEESDEEGCSWCSKGKEKVFCLPNRTFLH